MRVLLFGVCFGMMLATVSAAFSAQLTQNAGYATLANGPNSVTLGGGTWSTSNIAGFSDGQFQTDGGYIVPVGGVYHFDATMQIQVSTTSTPDETVYLRFVRCAQGCNALCTGGSDVAETLLQSGTVYLDTGFDSAFPPTFSISASFTGQFNTGDLVGLCLDSNAQSNSVKLVCPTNQVTCAFSGFTA